MRFIPIYLLFIIELLLVTATSAQTNKLLAEIPEKYLNEFKEQQKDYLEKTTPSGDSARRVYSLWSVTTRSVRKNYNEDSLLNTYRTLRRYEILSKVNYIKQNSDFYVSLFYLKQDLLMPAISLYLPPDSLLSIYSVLNEELKNTLLGKAVNEEIIKRNSLAIGKKIPGFTFKTDNGTILSLSAFKSKKYVLLAFWASWCEPCRENIPALKEVEKVYRDKSLQIISISVDKDTHKWLEAVKKYQMLWPQTCDVPSYIEGNIAKSLYNVQYIPQYFLIDKEGVLIYHNVLSKDDDSHSLLKSILHNALN